MSSIESRIAAAKNHTAQLFFALRGKAAGMGAVSPSIIGGDAAALPSNYGTSTAANQLLHFTGHAYTAISAIAKRLAGQRICVGRTPGKGASGPRTQKMDGQELEAIPDHPLLQLLERPNSKMIYWQLLHCTIAGLNLTGRIYWLFADGGNGYEIWPVPSSWIEPANRDWTVWNFKPRGQAHPVPIPGEFVIPFWLPDPGDPDGGAISPLGSQAAAIDADEQLQKSQARAFAAGSQPGMVVTIGELDTTPGSPARRPELTPDQRLQIINSIRRAYSNWRNWNDPIILDALIKDVKPYTTAPKEMDFLDSGKQTRSRIFAAFGVNPLIVGEIEGANRAQATVAEEAFCSNVLGPLASLLSQIMTARIPPLFGDEPLKIWIDPPRAHDPEQTLREWSVAATRGFTSVNEFRVQILGLPPVTGGDEIPALAAVNSADPAAQLVKQLVSIRDPYSLKTWRNGGS